MIGLGEGKRARIREVDAGRGSTASVSTPFSGVNPYTIKPCNYVEAVLAQDLPRRSDLLVDVYDKASGLKVMSLDVADGEDRLVNYTSGPWEQAFGLPSREWAPSVARRLASRRNQAA